MNSNSKWKAILAISSILCGIIPCFNANAETEVDDSSTLVNWFENGGFENGTINPGYVNWGNVTIGVTQEEEDINSGQYALEVRGGAGAYQIDISDLSPGTEYNLTFYGKSQGKANVGIKEFNSDLENNGEVYVQLTEGYAENTLTFTMGENDTSASFYVYNTEECITYVDDIEMLYNNSGDNGSNSQYEEELNETPAVFPFSDQENTRKWKLSTTLSDEFDSNHLDTEKWYNKHTYWSGRQPSCFEEDNVRVENGKLVLTSKYVSEPTENMNAANELLSDNDIKYENFASSCVQSTRKTGYGYYEIKARIAPISMTSSFWFQDDEQSKKEIDVFEQVGRPIKGLDPSGADIPINTHDFANGWENDVTTPYTYKSGIDLTADYHVYGLEWDKYFLRFYLDGDLIHEIKNTCFTEPQYVFFDMETFDWIGYPDPSDFKIENGRFSGDFDIEYFRVWRSDVPQSDSESDLPQNKLPEPKQAVAAYGTPVIEQNSSAVDPVWDEAYEIGELFVKNGQTDIIGSVKTMWDENYLYILAQMIDEDIYISDLGNWNSDSFEVYIDFLNEKNEETYDENDFKINLCYNGVYDSTENAPDNVVHNRIITDDGYIVQFKIPWMYVKPKNNLVIGFDAQINDATNQNSGRAGYLGWNDTIDNVWQSMKSSGNLRLECEKESISSVDKTVLEKLLLEIEKMDASRYTEDSFKNLMEAEKRARLVLEDPFANQTEVDEQVGLLNDAIRNLQDKGKTVTSEMKNNSYTVQTGDDDTPYMYAFLGGISIIAIFISLIICRRNIIH